jgi:hypothetical protein
MSLYYTGLNKDPNDPDQDHPDGNSAISAGYTYVGQFVAHDFTFDPASLTERIKDDDALEDSPERIPALMKTNSVAPAVNQYSGASRRPRLHTT